MMRECTLTTESRIEECGIVAQVVKCAPRVCGDDPVSVICAVLVPSVLPAYAGMILMVHWFAFISGRCSPRMRG